MAVVDGKRNRPWDPLEPVAEPAVIVIAFDANDITFNLICRINHLL